MTKTQSLLSVNNVFKSYPLSGGWMKPAKELQAVRGVSFALGRGETLGIVGESGCGKSTLAKLLLRLEKTTAGEVLLEGQPVSVIDRLEFSRRVQPVFQDPFSTLNPRRTVRDTVRYPLVVHGRGNARDQERAASELLELVGLPRRAYDAYPNQLSGGQRQRVAIARALVLRPDILICDEPTSALDVSIQAQILNLIKDIQRQLGVGIIFISHNLAVVEHVADRLAVMYLGRVVETGPAAQVMASPAHPYTQALLASVLTPYPRLGLPELNLGHSFPDPTNIPAGCSFEPRCAFSTEMCQKRPPEIARVHTSEVECHFAGALPKRKDAALEIAR